MSRLIATCVTASLLICCGAAKVEVDHLPRQAVTAQTPYDRVPAPDPNNAARLATVSIVDGRLGFDSGPPDRLVDGRMPDNEDMPRQNLKFDENTLEGRVKLDLGHVISIAAITSYSWHKDHRAPQEYKVYGSDGSAKDFNPVPKIGTDPSTCGWSVIASVDTRPKQGPPGGRYAVRVSDPSGTLGNYRYLLFVMFPTETDDQWGHTFYSEINVIEAK